MTLSWRDRLKEAVGRLALILVPPLDRLIGLARFPGLHARLTEAMRYARLARASASADLSGVEAQLAAFWEGDRGDRFHTHWNDDRVNHFLAEHSPLLDRFAALAAARGFAASRLVEIGCGDGRVLEIVADRLPAIPALIGIDLNAEAVTGAAARLAGHPRLAFHQGDGRAWLDAHPQAGTVLFTNGGVLEYFAPASLDALLASLAAQAPAAAVLIEPRDPGHDFDAQPGSVIFGREKSFSHNYRARLQAAGFTVAACDFLRTVHADWVLVVAFRD